MEVTQNTGLTLCPVDGLSDSDDETPEDLALSTSLSIHLREDLFILSREISLKPESSQFNIFFMQIQQIYYLQRCYLQN